MNEILGQLCARIELNWAGEPPEDSEKNEVTRYPSDTGLEICALAFWGRACDLSVAEVTHNIKSKAA